MVSVCIATYNGQLFIRQQIDSILSQLDPNDEIIISDDGSIDNTIGIINSYNDPRVKILINHGKHGYTHNFENALRHAKGDYIFTCDQDDIWDPNKVIICKRYLEKYDFICHDASMINADNNVIASSFFEQRKTPHSIWGNVIRFSGIGCCFCFKKKVLNLALPFPPNDKFVTHDNWLFLISSLFFNSSFVSEKLIMYRRHIGAISSGGSKSKNSIWMMFKYRVYIFAYAISRFFRKRKSHD